MTRKLFLSLFVLAATCTTVSAGDHYHFPGYVFAQPVVYAAPVVRYQPAYVVPTPVVAVHTVPVTTVSYSTHYYAPVVPTIATYHVPRPVVAPVLYRSPIYTAPMRVGRRHLRPYRGVEIEVERDGDIEIDYR